MQERCPEIAVLADLVSGRLDLEQAASLERHLDACVRCAALIPVGMVSGSASQGVAQASRGLAGVGAVLGRYEVRRWLGSGGMGDVYEGFDPELERRVALKLLRPEVADGPVARRRLAAEARSMARLSHPNVVAVLDVGVVEERAFVVMELVDGATLDRWLRERRRAWREIVSLFLKAGEGLAAAHEVGVVHRDFKPQNVMVGSHRDRVCVTDFGLARLAASAPSARDGAVPPAGLAAKDGLASRVVGTPRYMAPEQRAGGVVDGRSDQYSFCVALYEALLGRVPPSERDRGLPGGPFRLAGDQHGVVPRGLLAVLARGLALTPDERFSSMRHLLAGLRGCVDRGWHRRRLWASVVTAIGIVIVIAALAVISRVGRDPMSAKAAPFVVSGEPVDWSGHPVVADVPGRVFCLQVLDPGRVRIVWDVPRKATDIDINTGRRQPSDLAPDAYRRGCPQLSPDGRQLLFEGYDVYGRPHIFHSDNPQGRDARPVVSCNEPFAASEPLWLSTGRDFAFDLDERTAAVYSLSSGTIRTLRSPEGASVGFVKLVDPRGDAIGVFHSGHEGMFDGEIRFFRWPELDKVQERRTVSQLHIHRWRFMPGGRVIWGPLRERGIDGRTFAMLELDGDRITRLGRVQERDADILDALGDGRAVAVVASTRDEVRFRGADGAERVVPGTSGHPWSPVTAGDGRILFVEVFGTYNRIVSYDPAIQRSRTILDHSPVFGFTALPDARLVLGLEGDRRGLHLCTAEATDCRPLFSGTILSIPAVSTDGHYVAYVRDSPRGIVHEVLSLLTGETRFIRTGMTLCGLAWSGPTTLWLSARERGALSWTEIDVETLTPTGRTAPATEACAWTGVDPGAPVRPSAWIGFRTRTEIRVISGLPPAIPTTATAPKAASVRQQGSRRVAP